MVILALGFVLTSQITNRVLDVKVRAATEEVERARTTVSGVVSGEALETTCDTRRLPPLLRTLAS